MAVYGSIRDLLMRGILHGGGGPATSPYGRSVDATVRGAGWTVGPGQAGYSVGPSTGTAASLGLTGAQGEDGETISDPTSEEYVFIGNIACCPECARMTGMRVPAGTSLMEISHPNCRCQIVPLSVARNMGVAPNPTNPETGRPYTDAGTRRYMLGSKYEYLWNEDQEEMRRRRNAAFG